MSEMSLNVTQVKKGPTLKIYLTALCNGFGAATTETFVIDNLAKVSLKMESVNFKSKHKISMLAIRHELANNDAICMDVTCNAVKYSKTWPCSLFIYAWIPIGETTGSRLLINENIYLSQIEITLRVYTMTKPAAFPMLYEDCDFTDFTLSSADGKVAVHKACLAAHSPVFKAMFTGTWKEAKENVVELKDCSLQTIQHLKDFLYLGTLPNDGLRPLIRLAALYSINDLTKACARKLAETVRPEDLYSLHELACAINIPELSWALSQLTLDQVFDQGYQMKKKNDENQVKLNDNKNRTSASRTRARSVPY